MNCQYLLDRTIRLGTLFDRYCRYCRTPLVAKKCVAVHYRRYRHLYADGTTGVCVKLLNRRQMIISLESLMSISQNVLKNTYKLVLLNGATAGATIREKFKSHW